MDDHDHELLKWVAEELLGWQKVLSPSKMAGTERWMVSLLDHPARWYEIEEMLESWHGIGLVVEAIGKKDAEIQREFLRYLPDHCAWIITWERPWIPVYEAVRKAVTND